MQPCLLKDANNALQYAIDRCARDCASMRKVRAVEHGISGIKNCTATTAPVMVHEAIPQHAITTTQIYMVYVHAVEGARRRKA